MPCHHRCSWPRYSNSPLCTVACFCCSHMPPALLDPNLKPTDARSLTHNCSSLSDWQGFSMDLLLNILLTLLGYIPGAASPPLRDFTLSCTSVCNFFCSSSALFSFLSLISLFILRCRHRARRLHHWPHSESVQRHLKMMPLGSKDAAQGAPPHRRHSATLLAQDAAQHGCWRTI